MTKACLKLRNHMPQAGFNPLGEKWHLCLNIVVALPPKPPWLDKLFCYWLLFFHIKVYNDLEFKWLPHIVYSRDKFDKTGSQNSQMCQRPALSQRFRSRQIKHLVVVMIDQCCKLHTFPERQINRF